jgi:hypothetical protein
MRHLRLQRLRLNLTEVRRAEMVRDQVSSYPGSSARTAPMVSASAGVLSGR